MSDSVAMVSPFSPKLGTNYCPNDDEVVEIRALLVVPTLRLERLDNEIAVMRKALEKLTEERDGLNAYVAGHKALISPVRRLPLDIIQEIFTACMPTHRNCVMSAREAPVLLGRICGSWRTLSLATPHLWASLHLVEARRPFPSSNPQSYALFEAKLTQRLETAKVWLGRSGQCPLSISLDSPAEQWGTPQEPPPLPTERFLQALIQFAPRWQHMSFRVQPAALESLLPIAESDVPFLESITLSLCPHNILFQINWERFRLFGGTRISRFSISGSNFRFAESPLRWQMLTSLSILGPPHFDHPADSVDPLLTSEAALQIISRCTALRSCVMRLVESPSMDLIVHHPIVEHQSIETFELACVGIAVGSLLLGRLSLPRMRNFTLRIYPFGMPGGTQGPEASSLLLQLLGSSTHLETIDIDTVTFSKSSLVEILDSLPPTVLHLGLDDNPRSDDGWGWNQPTHSSELDDDVLQTLATAPHCPALQTLYIRYSSTISDEGLLQFINTRMAVFPLQRVQIEFSRPLQRDIMPDLQLTIDGGLDVQITYPPPIMMFLSPWQGLPDAFEEH
ncbi:hypothetical protein DFH09DRAFT_290191 [Mycena vulgaris]|nr:hypothetical protein DFH09DRAFT_290191 [Mycena vulgaris]